jgi:hypothetical protein
MRNNSVVQIFSNSIFKTATPILGMHKVNSPLETGIAKRILIRD